jgi:hypothetical protein
MAAPAFSEMRQEAERISRAIPEMDQKAESLREMQERSEQVRADLIDVCGKIMQVSDRLIAEMRALPNEYTPEQAATLDTLEQGRQLAFERMSVFNPEEAFLWTPEMQASLRASDAYFASGQSRVLQSEEEFDTFLREQSADV